MAASGASSRRSGRRTPLLAVAGDVLLCDPGVHAGGDRDDRDRGEAALGRPLVPGRHPRRLRPRLRDPVLPGRRGGGGSGRRREGQGRERGGRPGERRSRVGSRVAVRSAGRPRAGGRRRRPRHVPGCRDRRVESRPGRARLRAAGAGHPAPGRQPLGDHDPVARRVARTGARGDGAAARRAGSLHLAPRRARARAGADARGGAADRRAGSALPRAAGRLRARGVQRRPQPWVRGRSRHEVEPPRPSTADFEIYGIHGGNVRLALREHGIAA